MKKVNEFLNHNIEKILILFLYLQPILDVATAVMIHKNISFTLGIIIRMIFFLFMIYYLLVLDKNKTKKKSIIYLVLILIYLALFITNIGITKGVNSLSYEIKNLIKCFYFPVLLISTYELYQENKIKINKNILSNLFVTYLLLVFIPNILHLGFASYEITKKGSIGFFYTANEIGAILSILMSFYIDKIIKKKNKLNFILSMIIIFYTLTSMGTKGPLLSFIIILGYYFIKYLIECSKKKKYKMISLLGIGLITIIGISILIIPKTTFYKNILVHLEFLEVEELSDLANLKTIDHFIFSERLKFLKNTATLWLDSSISEKLLGIGYIDNYATDEISMKMIEMDYFDIFFRQGIIGFLVFILGFLLIIPKQKKKKKVIEPYLLSIILALLLALLTGHVLLAPAVSIFVALIFNLFYNEFIKE